MPIHVLERQNATGKLSWLQRLLNLAGLVSFLGLAVLLVRAAFLADTPWWWWALSAAGLATATLAALRDARCLDSTDSAYVESSTHAFGTKMDLVDELADSDHQRSHDSVGAPIDLVREFEGEIAAEPDSRTGSPVVPPGWLPHALRRWVQCGHDTFVPALAAWSPFRWVDIYAVWDPVPNGPVLLDRPRSIPRIDPGRDRTLVPTWSNRGDVVLPESYPISNDTQPWFDHVTYRTNAEDVVGRFALEIAAAAENPVPDALSAYEHKRSSDELPPDGQTLSNDAAERGRSHRRMRGTVLFGGQIATMLSAVGILVHRSDLIAPLGQRAMESLPGWVLGALSDVTDLVPTWSRDLMAGGVGDRAHGYGVLLVLLALATVFLVEAVAMRMWQRRASALFARGSDRPGAGWFAMPVVLAALVGILSWQIVLAAEPDPPISVAVAIQIGGERVPGTVTLQPLGAGEDAATVLEVTDVSKDTRVRLRGDQFVVSELNVPGSEDCDTTFTKPLLRIECTAKAPLIPGE